MKISTCIIGMIFKPIVDEILLNSLWDMTLTLCLIYAKKKIKIVYDN
jgi:hypothetical protein